MGRKSFLIQKEKSIVQGVVTPYETEALELFLLSLAPTLRDPREESFAVNLAGNVDRDSPQGPGWNSVLDPCADTQT